MPLASASCKSYPFHMILYGIPTCDTCRKALKALKDAGRDPSFRNVRAEPLSAAEISKFYDEFGDRLVNRASATWRGLSETERSDPPEHLLAKHATLMKRPVIEVSGKLYLGWASDTRSTLLE